MAGADVTSPPHRSLRGRHLLVLVTEDWYFCMHWMPIAVAARATGLHVTVATRVVAHGELIREAGLDLVPIDLGRSGTNPARDIATILRLTRLYGRLRPDVVQHIAVKPVLYGSIAARLAGVPSVVNTVAGLGYVFSSTELLARVLRPLVAAGYRMALAPRRHQLVVQNSDDLEFFVRHAGVARERAHVIRGVGVDVERFAPVPEPDGVPCVLLPARLLLDKGVVEFVAAARLLRDRGIVARFAIAGDRDPQNPGAVSAQQVDTWSAEGTVVFLGWQRDMAAVLRTAHIICLPSYREGLPTALTEAAACGRPIVTCDVQGCREVVRDGDNGLLVPPRDPVALADALERLITDATLRQRMGIRGRERALVEFSTGRIVGETLALYREAS
ncbi:MAG: glycosyltransferase family 4 protein [Pseudomonadota bacterium]